MLAAAGEIPAGLGTIFVDRARERFLARLIERQGSLWSATAQESLSTTQGHATAALSRHVVASVPRHGQGRVAAQGPVARPDLDGVVSLATAGAAILAVE